MHTRSATGEKTRAYCQKHPTASNLQLARMLHRDFPLAFTSIESARTSVRYYRDAIGAVKGRYNPAAKVKRLALPEPAQPNFKRFTIPTTATRWLILADLHVPYHDNGAIQVALDYATDRKTRCDGVLYLGDVADCYSISSWERDPTKRNLAAELRSVGQMFDAVQSAVCPKATIWRLSNHEHRLERYLWRAAPEIVDLSLVRPKQAECDELPRVISMTNLLCTAERHMTVVPPKCPMEYHNMTLLHGDEWNSATGGVNPARTAYMKTHACAMVAHSHKTSEHTENTVRGTTITCWSVGALCDLHPDYAALNGWNHGFAVLDLTRDTWRVENKRIVDGEAV